MKTTEALEILKFIFYLGIIYAIFGLLWGIINFLYKSVREKPSKLEMILLRVLGYYFLASLTVIYVFDPFNLTNPNSGSFAFMSLGGIVLYFYLISKMNKRKNIITPFSNQKAQNVSEYDIKIEAILIGVTLLFYIVALLYPEIGNHALNDWFYMKIQLIYDTFILNFIFGLIGIAFLIQILVQGMNSSGMAINLLTGKKTKTWSAQNSQVNNEYDDYEIVDDDTQDDSSSNLLN